MKKAKIAVIGVGSMGREHAKEIDQLDNAELVGICDIDQPRANRCADLYNVPPFIDYRELLDNVDLDGVLIATPHYSHPPIAIQAFNCGIHVLTEKPLAAHIQGGQEMIAAYEKSLQKCPNLVFAAMFQQRTYGFWRRIKSLIDGGDLGQLIRTTWIITDWFRTQSYYDNGGWRATWKGEGGGVLLNQCPHNLDLFQWFVGMPKRVTGFASVGKYHTIEVEDEVTAYLEYENGMIGHLVTSTGESPGTNRLEIAGENGKLIFEDNEITFFRNRESAFDFIKSSTEPFAVVAYEKNQVPYEHHGRPGHKLVIENFANAILHREELVAPAIEGFNSLALGNAIMMSSFLGRSIDLPLDARAYTAKLRELIDNSSFEKNVVELETTSMGKSF